jgi:hypothetical protein
VTEQPGGAESAAREAPAAAPIKPLNGVALAKEVALQRLQDVLEWLLARLKRYRAKRGDWWER